MILDDSDAVAGGKVGQGRRSSVGALIPGADKVDYNYRLNPWSLSEAPGISVFLKDEGGRIYHTYSTYARGLDMLNVAYHYMDLVPKGRDESDGAADFWVRRRDEYPD